jgi:hypothetical protein
MEIHPPPQDIDLEPHDWYIANWRNLPPLPRQAPRPFDRAACLKRLRKVKVHTTGEWGWSAARIPHWMTAEEARFWLDALLASDNAADPAALADDPGSPAPTDPAALAAKIRQARKGRIPELIAVLAAMFKEDVLAKVLAAINAHESILLPGFRRYVRPYLDDDQREAMRTVLARVIGALPRRSRQISVLVAGLAASVGMPDLIAEILDDPRNIASYHAEQYPFLGLGLCDRKKVAVKAKGNDHIPFTAERVRGTIAHLEDGAMECFEQVLRWGDRDKTEKLVRELARIRRVSLAPVLVKLQANRRCAAAQRWLDAHPETALEGLRDSLEDSQLRPTILDYLRGLIRTDKQALVEQFLTTVSDGVAERLRQELQTAVAGLSVAEGERPAWFPPLAEAKLPAWLDVARLPPILVTGKPLPASCIPTVLAALRESTLDEPRALIALLKQHAEPRSLDAFAQGVFDRWQAACGKFNDRWAIGALGLLGGDGACLRLEKAIAGWATQRAEYGAHCLRAIQSEQALASLFALSKQNRVARNLLWDVQQKQGISSEELEDMAVPRLGLHERNTIEFGSEAFRMSLAPDLAPCLLDARHHRHSDLPAMLEDDDPVKADLARAEWNVFRPRVGEIVPEQRLRLEMAMRYQRRWRAGFFSRVLMAHPLLEHFVRPLVWGAFEGLKLRFAFRVGPGGAVDIASAPVALEDDRQIGIVHPTDLSREERMVWNDVLAEQGLQPPFVQLAREVFVVEEAERGKKQCERFSGRVAAGKKWAPFLAAHAWQGQKYWTPRVWKWFPLSEQFGCVELISSSYSEQLALESGFSAEKVTIGVCYATRPKGVNEFSYAATNRLKLEDVSPMVFDEMMRLIDEAPTPRAGDR